MDSKTAEQNTEMNKEGDIRNELELNTAIPSQDPVAAQKELEKLEEKLLNLLLNN
ncbi:MAG: hypothetical protein QXS53_00520 [Candidatus Anstonellales archaeon]